MMTNHFRRLAAQLGGIILAMLFVFGNSEARFQPLRSDLFQETPVTQVVSSETDRLVLEYRLPGLELGEVVFEGRSWDRAEIPGGGTDLTIGVPEIPHFTRLLIIPEMSGVRAEFEALETKTIPDLVIWPAQELEAEEMQRQGIPLQYDQKAYSQDAFYPNQRLQIGEPALLRGLRVISLRVNPVQYNPVSRELQVTTHFRVIVRYEGTDRRNVPNRFIPLSTSWMNSLQSQVLNLDETLLDTPSNSALGPYLVICENDATLQTNLQPLIDWKKRKGHPVTLQTFAPGTSSSSIKNLIQTAYNTWEIPPEYVLLFGDTAGDYALPGWSPDGIDHPYAQLEGNDILADLAIGRLPADNTSMSLMMVNKVLLYERTPYTSNTDWFHQGVLVAGDNSWINSGLSTVQVNRWIKTRMIWNNYTRIDTMWYWMGGSVANTIANAINNGVVHCNYRGMQGMGDFSNSTIDNLTNGRKQPLVVTITCDTGGFDGSSESFMEHFVSVGTASTPKGAVAAIGTATTGTHTKFNNTVAYGIYAGIFDENLTQPGHALNRGKLELYNAYQTVDPGAVTNFTLWNALAGDPGMDLFTAAIQFMTCDVPDNVTWGENTLSLTVNQSGVGPLADATVCLYKAGELQVVGLTDDNGQVELPLTGTTAGNAKVTITKHNYFPLVDSLNVVQEAVAVGYLSHTIDDDNTGGSSGDNDHVLNPGETIEIPLVFKNYGNATTATNVGSTATESDLYAALTDSVETFPNLSPGATGNSLEGFDLTVSPNCPHGHTVWLNLTNSSAQGSWAGLLELPVVSYAMSLATAYPVGSDTLLSPGETADFILVVKNEGGKTAANLTATLTSLDPYVTVNDNSAAFGSVNVGVSANCNANPFNLTAAANAPSGHLADLRVTFTSAAGAVQIDTLTITLGSKSTDDPQGPDEYGYFCFDNTDLNYGPAPVYNWVEIDPDYGGTGTQLNLYDSGNEQDASVNVHLPFTFRYYGQDVTDITVCSNGWISTIPNLSFTDFRNYPIPSPIGPNGMIAPFWDDLTTQGEGRVYTKHDLTNHYFLIEWSRTPYLSYPTPVETFEVILYDPIYHPTPTGDGDIVFQYNSITEVAGPWDDNGYSTVGIESPDQQDGIEVVYWNIYSDPATAQLQNGRAYRFTTNFSYTPPGGNLYVNLTPSGLPIVIPPGGGSFNFNIAVGNNGTTQASADVWCSITLPNGSSYGPVLGPVLGLALPAGWSTNRNRTQNVPANAPAGNYTYHAYLGTYPATVYTEDSFPFSKSGDDGSNDWFTGWWNTGEEFQMTTVAAEVLPQAFALREVYPNPFNAATSISFDLPQDSYVDLRLYDLTGRVVGVLAAQTLSGGAHRLFWEAQDLASGVYLLRLQAQPTVSGAAFSATRKLVLLK